MPTALKRMRRVEAGDEGPVTISPGRRPGSSDELPGEEARSSDELSGVEARRFSGTRRGRRTREGLEEAAQIFSLL